MLYSVPDESEREGERLGQDALNVGEYCAYLNILQLPKVIKASELSADILHFATALRSGECKLVLSEII